MKRIANSKGFTIIELLIATVIFSVVLLVITGAIVQFGRIYYRGVVQSRTQERARAITDSVAKNLQFSKKGSFSKGTDCYRIGNQSYTYNLKTQVDSSNYGLLQASNGCPGAPTDGVEMLGERMQLVALDITEINPGTYKVHVRVVYGSSVDFEKNNPSDTTGDPSNPCNPIILGGQYCAVSELTTTVVSRLRE